MDAPRRQSAPEGLTPANVPQNAPSSLKERDLSLAPAGPVAASPTVAAILHPVPVHEAPVENRAPLAANHQVKQEKESLQFFSHASALSGQFAEYSELAQAIKAYNADKTDANLNAVLEQLQAIPGDNGAIQDLKHEILINKLVLLSQTEDTTLWKPDRSLNLSNDFPLNSTEAGKTLKEAIDDFNKSKTQENCVKVLKALSDHRLLLSNDFLAHKSIQTLIKHLAAITGDLDLYRMMRTSKTDQQVQVVAQEVFKDYPDIHTPKAKLRGFFNVSHLETEKGFVIKYFKYLGQMWKRRKTDTYLGLRNAVAKFNQEKTFNTIQDVIKHIKLLKTSEGSEFNDETLVRIANEAALSKMQMLSSKPDGVVLGFEHATKLGKFNIPSPDIQAKIKAYNADRNPETFHALTQAIFEWMPKNPDAFANCQHEVQKLLYQLGSAIRDPQLGELFGLLKIEKTLIAYKKVSDLAANSKEKAQPAILNCNGTVLNIPQVNCWFSSLRSKELKGLKQAINTFNKDKTPANFNAVLTALQSWQYAHNDSFNSSNGLKIVSVMTDILDGVSMQDNIKKLDSYHFYLSLQKAQNKPDSKWNLAQVDFHDWNLLKAPKSGKKKTPSAEMQAVIKGVAEFNGKRKTKQAATSLMQLFKDIESWALTHPHEFNLCKGENLLKNIQKQIVRSVTKDTLYAAMKFNPSKEFSVIQSDIRRYNANPSVSALKQIHISLKIWQETHQDKEHDKGVTVGEFRRFHGDVFIAQVEALLTKAQAGEREGKPITLPSILMPSTHPPKVFDQSLALANQADGEKNAFIMIFHNPIAPWSHSDIGFVTGPAALKSSSFVTTPPKLPSLEGYFKDGMLIKELNVDDFPPEHQHFIKDIRRYKIIKTYDESCHLTQASFQNCNMGGASGLDADVYDFLKQEGYLDENGKVEPNYFTDLATMNANGKFEFDINLEKVGYTPEVIAAVKTSMPKPLGLEMLAREVEIAKSKDAFETFKKQGYLDENGKLKRECVKGSPMWAAIRGYFKGDDEYLHFLQGVMANPIDRTFTPTSFIRQPLNAVESAQLFEFLKSKGLVDVQKNSRQQDVYFLKADWETKLKKKDLDDLPEGLRQKQESVLHILEKTPASGKAQKRDYLGIGAETEGLDESSQHAEGVRLTDSRLTSRLEKLCERRKNEIQKNMNVFSGASAGARSMMKGAYATLLRTNEDKERHIRQALIDNFLTTTNPNAFLPNLKEPRYRLELYESGGNVYRKWVEDPNGQFSKVKNPSSASGEYVEGEYKRNSCELIDGKLRSVKKADKAKEDAGEERGNIVENADGTKTWMADPKFGQYFKPKGADVDKAVRDTRVLYPSMNCEKYLANGEKEWCGSCVVRLLHSAYAHEYMPEFPSLLENLGKDFEELTGFKKDSQFEKRHAQALFLLADQYAKQIVKSEAGRKYFRDMNPTVRVSPRCTPDMIHEFLTGKAPGVVNSVARAAKTMQMPASRNLEVRGGWKVLVAVLHATLSVLATPTASLKLAANVIAAVTGTAYDVLWTAPSQAVQRKIEELGRKEEAGIRVKHKAARLAGSAAVGFVKGGLIKRVAGQFLGGDELIRSVKAAGKAIRKKKEISAFA